VGAFLICDVSHYCTVMSRNLWPLAEQPIRPLRRVEYDINQTFGSTTVTLPAIGVVSAMYAIAALPHTYSHSVRDLPELL